MKIRERILTKPTTKSTISQCDTPAFEWIDTGISQHETVNPGGLGARRSQI